MRDKIPINEKGIGDLLRRAEVTPPSIAVRSQVVNLFPNPTFGAGNCGNQALFDDGKRRAVHSPRNPWRVFQIRDASEGVHSHANVATLFRDWINPSEC